MAFLCIYIQEAHPTDGWQVLMNLDQKIEYAQPQTEAELAALRHCVNRGTPFGEKSWVENTAARLGLAATLRPRGRPKKITDDHQESA